jgi:hypothetical protein
MGSPLSSERDAFVVASESSSPGRLLETGCHYIRQGRYVEGVAMFAFARERISPDQSHVVVILDAFMKSHEIYVRVQEELHQASKRFTRADAEQQMQIATLESMLPSLLKEADTVSFAANNLQQNARDDRLLQASHSSSSVHNDAQQSKDVSRRASEENGEKQTLPASSDDIYTTLPGLSIICFGHFEVMRLGQPLILCANRYGQAILRYLAAQSERGVEHHTTSPRCRLC